MMTRKCPYCAEDVHIDAIFCKHCTRRIKGRYKRFLVLAVIMAIGLFYYTGHKKFVDRSIRVSLRNVGYVYRSIGDIIRDLPAALKALKDYPEQTREINTIISEAKGKVEEEIN